MIYVSFDDADTENSVYSDEGNGNKWGLQASIINYKKCIYFVLWYEEFPKQTKSPVIPHY